MMMCVCVCQDGHVVNPVLFVHSGIDDTPPPSKKERRL